MKFTIEQVDLLRSRAKVGYKEAKEALEMFDGDIVDALAYLEEQKKTGNGCCENDFMGKVKKIIKKGNQTFMHISKKDETILNLPLTIVVPLAVIAPPFIAFAIVAAIFLGCKIRIKKANGEEHCMNKHFEHAVDIVGNAAEKFAQEIKTE